MTLPITIIGGYLGAGKTSMVNHLLRHANGLRLAVLVNEFGALPIDEDLIEAEDDDIISIAGGCVCCSYGNDLILALMKLADLQPRPDHVVLEASGVAIPSAIASTVSLLQGYSLDGVLVLANAETIEEQAKDAYIGDTILRQLHDADMVIVNKIDLVSKNQVHQVHEWLQTVIPNAQIVECRHGKVPKEVLLQSYLDTRETDFAQSHPEANAFQSQAFAIEMCPDPERLAKALAEPALGLIRAKGFVRTGASEVKSVQTLGRRWWVAPAPENVASGLVVIALRSRLDTAAVQAAINGAAARTKNGAEPQLAG